MADVFRSARILGRRATASDLKTAAVDAAAEIAPISCLSTCCLPLEPSPYSRIASFQYDTSVAGFSLNTLELNGRTRPVAHLHIAISPIATVSDASASIPRWHSARHPAFVQRARSSSVRPRSTTRSGRRRSGSRAFASVGGVPDRRAVGRRGSRIYEHR